MKRTLSLILAILMVVTIFATVGMAEDEPEAAGEPETVETAAPAAEGPAAPVEEVPAEPAAEPEVVPASEPAAEPNAEPAPISEEPADNGIAPVSEPTPTAVPVVTWVELDCNGGSYLGYARHTADVFDGNLHSGIKPVRDGYEFVGWYTTQVGDNPNEGDAIHNGDSIQGKSGDTLYAGWKPIPEPTKPPETTDNYKYGVWLTVVNGTLNGNGETASVWVEFQDVKTRTLPSSGLPKATRSNGEFEGWYTQSPTEELKNGYWSTVTKNGVKIVPGETEVPQGVQVLYAAFNDKGTPEESEKLVTFYLHPNGMGGSNGALQVTRPYDKDVGGVKFTAENAAVYGINLNSTHTKDITGSTDQEKWKALKEIWEEETVNGYQFLGWYKADGTAVDGEQATPTVKDGDHLYAHWSLNEETHETTPTPAPTPGPVETIRIDAPGMTVRQDPTKPESVTVNAFVTPVGGTGEITWTVEVPPTVSEGHYENLFKSSEYYTIKKDGQITKKDGGAASDAHFTAKVDGLNLIITPQQGCSQVLYVFAECNGHTTPAPATVIIEHQVSEVKTVVRAATCTAAGEEGFVCAECGEVTDAETIPATGHSYCGHATCEVCGEAGKKGDPSGDGAIDTSDVRVLFLAAMNDGEGVAPEIGDVTGDGVIDTSDVRVLFLAAMNDGSLPG